MILLVRLQRILARRSGHASIELDDPNPRDHKTMLEQVEEGDVLREDDRLGRGVGLLHVVQLLEKGLDLGG